MFGMSIIRTRDHAYGSQLLDSKNECFELLHLFIKQRRELYRAAVFIKEVRIKNILSFKLQTTFQYI